MAFTYGFCLGEESRMYTSAEFSEAFSHVFGDGVCQWGSRFEASVSGLSLTLGSGFALAAGYWLKNDDPFALAVAPALHYADRTDLCAIQVDMDARKVSLAVLPSTSQDALPTSPYTIPLYSIRVKRGATNLLPEDLSDLRGYVPTLSSVTANALRAYGFITTGIDQKVARILGLGQALIDKGDKAIASLDAAIKRKGAGAVVGDLCTARFQPPPGEQWLLCDGSAIPAAYPALSTLLDGKLPRIIQAAPRISTYIFAGEPQEGGA